MKKQVTGIVNLFLTHGIIREDEKEIYQYGIWAGFLWAVNVITAVVIICLCGEILWGTAFLAGLMLIRSFAGGYHCQSPVTCYILSQSSIAVSVYLLSCLFRQSGPGLLWGAAGAYLVTTAVILRLAPMQADGNPLTDEEQRKYKKLLYICYGLLSLCAVGFTAMNDFRWLITCAVVNANVLTGCIARLIQLKRRGNKHVF